MRPQRRVVGGAGRAHLQGSGSLRRGGGVERGAQHAASRDGVAVCGGAGWSSLPCAAGRASTAGGRTEWERGGFGRFAAADAAAADAAAVSGAAAAAAASSQTSYMDASARFLDFFGGAGCELPRGTAQSLPLFSSGPCGSQEWGKRPAAGCKHNKLVRDAGPPWLHASARCQET